jgi:superfamily II DNA or RNA helicase
VLADALASAVGDHPGSTAAELSVALRSAGHDADEAMVHRHLYAAHGRFRCDDTTRARWWPAGAEPDEHRSGEHRAAAPSAHRPDEHRAAVPDAPALHWLSLYVWQAEALAAWVGRDRRGVVEAVTGTGKTMVGVAAVIDQQHARGQALVLVPTKEMQRQWIGVLRERLAPGTLIGRLGDGGADSLTTHDVVVGIVNTLRSVDARPIRPHGLLVADECHRYGSTFNRLALDDRFDRRLGLSATYARDDDGHLAWLDPYFGGSCYQLGYRRAIGDGVAARVAVALVGVRFTPHERAWYDELSEVMSRAAARLVERYGIACEPYAAFMREVNALADSSRDQEPARLARQYRQAATGRRRLLAEASGKGPALETLAPAIRAADRTIVFTQSIAASDDAARRLTGWGLPTGALHSRLPSDERADVLGRFASGSLRVVSAPRVLDEGVDLPAADLAVIVAASRSRRQMIQRMGRVLRRKHDARPARLAVLFVEGTVEDPASGAHQGFLGEVTGVADAVRRFAADSHPAELVRFLSPTNDQPSVTLRDANDDPFPQPGRARVVGAHDASAPVPP